MATAEATVEYEHIGHVGNKKTYSALFTWATNGVYKHTGLSNIDYVIATGEKDAAAVAQVMVNSIEGATELDYGYVCLLVGTNTKKYHVIAVGDA